MRSMAMEVVTGGNAETTGTLPRGAAAPAAPAATMPKTLATTMEAKATTPAGTMVTTTAVTILGLAMETAIVTTEIVTTLVTAATAATTTVVATTTTTSLATARPTIGERRGHPGADSLATTTATEGAVSETAIVPPTSSAVISGLATSAPAHKATIMVDQKTVK